MATKKRGLRIGDERWGEADFSVDPYTGNTWREALDYAATAIALGKEE
jgi:hypothetical protein